MESINAAEYGPPGSGGWGPPGGGYGAPPTPPAPPGGGYGRPPAIGAPPPVMGFVPPNAPMMPGAGGDANTTLPLLLNVLALVFCGLTILSAPFSIAGIVFAMKAKGCQGRGDIAGARAKASTSMLLSGIAILAGIVFLIGWALLAPAPPPIR